jgi:hypothetical protein
MSDIYDSVNSLLYPRDPHYRGAEALPLEERWHRVQLEQARAQHVQGELRAGHVAHDLIVRLDARRTRRKDAGEPHRSDAVDELPHEIDAVGGVRALEPRRLAAHRLERMFTATASR